ncbi:MAG: quinone-dependent dihydroorotate dehydrogenase [Rhodothermales bacterium]
MYDLVRSTLFNIDAERAHRLATAAARAAQMTRVNRLLEGTFEFDDIRLDQSIWGIDFANPVGLAAGFDKNAALVPFWATLGFGYAEVGSVSAQPSRGNPRPRAFRLPTDEALINRMGLNNKGAHKISRRLRRLKDRRRIPIGVNLAKTHDPGVMGDAAVEDFRASFELMAPHADYVALNISCPNTREGKTFEEPDALASLLDAVMHQREDSAPEVPVLLKLSPPLSDRIVFDSAVEAAVEIGLDRGIEGFIASNTASDREGLSADDEYLDAIGAGGLSGRPLEARSTHLVRYLYRLTGGAVPIIGVGGVFSAEDAYRKICAGASLVQVYTGLVYRGPGLVRDIKRGLVDLLERDGFGSIEEAVGTERD